MFRDIISKTVRVRFRGVPKPIDLEGIKASAVEATSLFHKLIEAHSNVAQELEHASKAKYFRDAGCGIVRRSRFAGRSSVHEFLKNEGNNVTCVGDENHC